MDGVKDEWISTGKAAAMLGYSAWGFKVKFKGLIPCRQIRGGNYRWSARAVMELIEVSEPKP